ncbi:hypothetical protein Tco_0819402 [Tanacetum coccineum]|uniref:Uncharacterized protein n=1 Tax=Tanacetum coccineum TaxID=301880 RepID=A0ABQ5AAQ1_9ASTR
MVVRKFQGNESYVITKTVKTPLKKLENERFFWAYARGYFACLAPFRGILAKNTTVVHVVSALTGFAPAACLQRARGKELTCIIISEIAEIVAEDAAPVQPRCQRKRKKIVSDADEPSHPPKKLREDHITLTGPSVAEQEDGDQTDFMAGANLRAITAPLRFVISLDSSHHSGANIAEAEVDSFSRPSVRLMTIDDYV